MGQTQMFVDHAELKKEALRGVLEFYGNKGCNFDQLLTAAEKLYQWLIDYNNG